MLEPPVKHTYHKNDEDKKQNWNDDVHDVVERFSIQVNGKLDHRIIYTVKIAVQTITTRGWSYHLPYVYKTVVIALIIINYKCANQLYVATKAARRDAFLT